MIHVRFKVTICLYLIPINRARSMSTLWPSTLTKTLSIMQSLIRKPRPLRIDKDPIVGLRTCHK